MFAKFNLPWHVVFVRAIGGNWIVTLAFIASTAAEDVIGRVVGFWTPLMIFIVASWEHCTSPAVECRYVRSYTGEMVWVCCNS